jgi:hypothetical protein
LPLPVPFSLPPAFTAPSSPLCHGHDHDRVPSTPASEVSTLAGEQGAKLPTLPNPPAIVPKFALLPPPIAGVVSEFATTTTSPSGPDLTPAASDASMSLLEDDHHNEGEKPMMQSCSTPPSASASDTTPAPAPAAAAATPSLWQAPAARRNSGLSTQ